MPLDRNESYWLLDNNLMEVVGAPSAPELSTYPDYSELENALARYSGVAPEQILITPGSATAIEYIVRAYAGEGLFTRRCLCGRVQASCVLAARRPA